MDIELSYFKALPQSCTDLHGEIKENGKVLTEKLNPQAPKGLLRILDAQSYLKICNAKQGKVL